MQGKEERRGVGVKAAIEVGQCVHTRVPVCASVYVQCGRCVYMCTHEHVKETGECLVF